MIQQQIVSSDISWASEANVRYWESVKDNPFHKLRLADAYLARINVGEWTQRYERVSWLKNYVGDILRSMPDVKEAYGDPHVRAMVRELWGEPGVTRLKGRAEAA
jgi:hypothetical protein